MGTLNRDDADLMVQAVNSKIESLVNQAVKNAPNDKETEGRVLSKNNDNTYNILIKNAKFTSIPQDRSLGEIAINTIVKVKIPNGQMSNAYICAVVDGTISKNGGGGSGSVTSVDVLGVAGITSSGGPITSKGTITVGHTNSVSAKTTQSLYPITFDAQGHITSSGSPVNIPVVNNGKLTIQKNGENVASFTANSSTDVTADISVPTNPQDIGAEPSFTKNTAFNKNFETSVANIKMNGTASVGSSTNVPRADHIHPTDTSRASQTDMTKAQTDITDLQNSKLDASKANTTVMKDLGLTATNDNVTLNKSYINISTQATSSESINVPLANDSTAGLMSKSDYAQIRDNTARIEQLEGQNIRLLYTASANPTATQIQQFVIDSGYADTTKWAQIGVVVQGSNHIWRYFNNTNAWQDVGVDTVNTFTNEIAGIIKGSNTDGKVYAETDGTGSVKGWDSLNTKVTNNTNAISTETTNRMDADTALQTNINSEKTARENADNNLQSQINENKTAIETEKTNINKKLEPSNIKAGANINITTSGNDVTINAVAEAGGTIVNVNGVKQDIIDFTSDPQTQINSKFNSTNVVQSTGTSTTQVMSQKATTDALAKKMDNFSISIGLTNGGNPRQVKFMSINYTTATSDAGVSIKLSMASGHGNGSSYRFLQDAILGVTYTGVVSVDVYKYYNASIGTFDGAARNYGDVFYVKDETNKIVDFYVLLGQYSTVKLTPYFRLNSSTGGVITQLSGTPTYYSSGTKVYGNNSLYAKKSDIPNVSQSTGTSTTDVMSQKATTDELNAITTALSNKFTNHPQSAYNCNTCYDEGVYLVANGSNCPSGSPYGSLFVMPYRKPTGNTKPDFCVQIYIPNGDDSTSPNSMFYRTSLADSWNSWQTSDGINNLYYDSSGKGYIRFNTGFQVVWGRAHNKNQTYNYAMPFKNGTSYSVAGVSAGWTGSYGNYGMSNLTANGFYLNADKDYDWCYIAVGVWK